MEACSLETSHINKKKVEGLIQRVCLPLELSDPGRILSLLRSLFENSSDILQMKINKYLAEVTNSITAFMILSFLRNKEYKVTVMGQRFLPLDIYISPDCELIKILTSNSVVEIPKECIENKLKEAVESRVADREKSQNIVVELTGFLGVTVSHPVSEKTLVYVVLVNPERKVDYKRICSSLVNECLRYCVGTLVNAVCYEEEKKEHERARNFIEILRETLFNIEHTGDMISEIRVRICDLMNAERCNIFLRDECGNFITNILHYGEQTEFAEEPMKNIKLPANYGLIGIVSSTGEIVNCEDASTDPRYCIDLDYGVVPVTRNVLCFPLFRDKEVVGAVEVYNKAPTRDCQVFTEADEKVAESLSILLTPLIFHSLNFKKILENCNRKSTTDDIFLQKSQATEESIDDVINCTVVHRHHDQYHFNFSHLEMSDHHLGCSVYEYFRKFGLIQRYNMHPRVLFRFILSIFKDQPEFPFHNWRQTFGTFNFASVIVNDLNLVNEGFCTHIEILSLLIAAMCFNADYRGALSIFQVSCGTTLGALYSTPAHINQQFQCSQIFRLLHKPETNILENIPAELFKVFTHLLKHLINTADIGCYVEKFSLMEASLKSDFRKDDLTQRLDLLSLFMGCSVLSDYSKGFNHCRRVAELSYAEFLPDVDRTAAEGVFDLEQFGSNIELIPHLQIQIISTICIPSFRLLSVLFPVTHPCLDRCQNNLATWEKYKDKFIEVHEAEKIAELIVAAEPEQE